MSYEAASLLDGTWTHHSPDFCPSLITPPKDTHERGLPGQLQRETRAMGRVLEARGVI